MRSPVVFQVASGRHKEGVFPHNMGVIPGDAEAAMAFIPITVDPGDIVLFDSYLPHR